MKSLKFVTLILLASLASLEISAQPRQINPDPSPLILLPREQELELALSAGPEHVRSDATVYVFGAKGYEKIRSGKNGFTIRRWLASPASPKSRMRSALHRRLASALPEGGR